jgi:fucose permease
VLGILYFTQGAGFLLTVVFAGWLSDRRGKFPVILAGSVFMGVGSALFAVTRSLPVGFFALSLVGVGGGLSEATSMAAVADLYSARKRTAMMNWAQTGFALGAVSSPLVIARLLSLGMNWRLGYLAAAAMCGISMVLAIFAVIQRREKPVVSHDHNTDWRKLLFSPLLIALAIGIMLYVGAESGQSNWLAVYFEDTLKAAPALAASTVAFFWVGISLGRIAATRLSKHMSDLQLIFCSLVLAVAIQTALLLAKSPAPAIGLVMLLGFGLGPVWPTILSRAGEAFPKQSGTVFGILVAMGAVGYALIPPIIGLAGDVMGIHKALWLCLIILVVNLCIFGMLRASDKRSIIKPAN